jgi:hypothetical protein
MGIFHSEFLARSQDDRDKAIWTYLRDRQTCSQCGTRSDEWDPAQGGDRAAYRAVAKTCRGCQEIESRTAALDETRAGRGVKVTLIRQEVADGKQA